MLIKAKTRLFLREEGISLIELLVAISLLTIVMGSITGMLIMSMRTQDEVNADFRSQLDVRQALYDMEKNLAEAMRKDSAGMQPIFQANALTVPTQR